jgi:hypothetical protein
MPSAATPAPFTAAGWVFMPSPDRISSTPGDLPTCRRPPPRFSTLKPRRFFSKFFLPPHFPEFFQKKIVAPRARM